MSNEFKKSKPPTFDEELKKPKDAEAWLPGMKRLFKLHDYTENMKAKIFISSLKGKVDIWWEDVKHVRGIKTEELSWHEFKILFKNKYLLERYYDNKAKEFYELKMGSMKDEEYMNNFMELLRYVPYLKDENMKVQIFVSGFLLAFKYWIEYDEPRSLEGVIRKLKHCYEYSRRKSKPKQGWKGNYKY